MAGKLTPKQEQFAREYTVDLCATQAAIRAGYSQKTAYRQGADNLKKPQIVMRIAELQSERNARTQISADQTIADLRELADIALGRKAYPRTIVIDGAAQTFEVRNVSFSGAARALELLGRHQGIFNDRVNVQPSGVEGLLKALAEVPASTPAGRIKARIKDGPYH